MIHMAMLIIFMNMYIPYITSKENVLIDWDAIYGNETMNQPCELDSNEYSEFFFDKLF